jgi:branched-chain amino acid transport system permease protein
LGDDRYIQRILLLIFLWAAVSSSFNIISGYGGQVVFGYMMYVGVGAYTSVLLFKLLGVSPWLGMWVGVIIACGIAFSIGLPTLRLIGAYFAVATVAFPLITIPILNSLGFDEVIIPFKGHSAASMQFTDMRFYVLITVGFLGGVLSITRKMELSRFGYALKALSQNEAAAEGMGINTYWTKMMGFMLSAGLGAIMGTIYSLGLLYVLTTSSAFGLSIIVRILSITIVGGIATLWGPLVAASFLVPAGEFLNAQFGALYPGVQDVIYGIALIIAITYMREGVWHKLEQLFFRLFQKSLRPAGNLGLENREENSPGTKEVRGLTQLNPVSDLIDVRNKETILKVDGVCKSFGGVQALRDINIEVPRGRILGIIGPNGAGKTTLFNVINGYLKADRGKVLFEGNDVTKLKPNSFCKLGIGRTFQVAQIFSRMTVIENVLVGAFAKEGDLTKAVEIAERVSEQMGIARINYSKAIGLTIWQTKMLEFSRALATQPKLLLVDEPMAGLNPEETDRIGEIIKMIAKCGITVIVIEHVVLSLMKIADFMVGLDDGHKIAEGKPETVTSNPHMIEAYLGKKWKERHAKT